MKILWVCPSFLHPTDRGGQIRTLGTLKELHKRHEIHFAALNPASNTEGPARSSEYASSYTAVEHAAPKRGSLSMIPQLAGSVFGSMPLAVSRYASTELRQKMQALIAANNFDSIVCDFLAAAPNVPALAQSVLFQHNVETTIWQRHVERAQSFLQKQFFAMQAKKMEAYEKKVCRESKFVIAVSDIDASRMKTMFGIDHVKAVPTGVDIDYFSVTEPTPASSDIVFCGSMDWLPNVDAVEHFILEILPLIRAQRPDTTVTIAGRSPDARIVKAAEQTSGIAVTGNVPDMRPYMWGSKISIVPIRIGGGTRLKIYECMAAGLPVISTTIGAEGLSYTAGKDILIADSPADFSAACLRLLSDEDTRRAIADNALALVQGKFSWAAVTADFEAILEANRITTSS
jgi:glycosyltransferase involved in cell wall biosynthesis